MAETEGFHIQEIGSALKKYRQVAQCNSVRLDERKKIPDKMLRRCAKCDRMSHEWSDRELLALDPQVGNVLES
jgi:hypothetical protein